MKPQKHNQPDYYNFKQYHFIQLQPICDSNTRFLDIYVGYGGSVQDTQVLRNSPIHVNALYPPPAYLILGDGGYPCLQRPISLISPSRHPLQNKMQERFNIKHARACSVIERAFRAMKSWWQATLLKALEVHPRFVSEVALACAFLHNVCLAHGDNMEVPDELQPDQPGSPAQDQDNQKRSGADMRDRLAAHASAPQQLLPPLRDLDYFGR